MALARIEHGGALFRRVRALRADRAKCGDSARIAGPVRSHRQRWHTSCSKARARAVIAASHALRSTNA